jgi:hypothetical protein
VEDIMKNLRQICLGLSLILALSASAFAGDILTPGFTAGPQESPGITGDILTPGITGNISTPGITGDMLTPGVVSLILAALF